MTPDIKCVGDTYHDNNNNNDNINANHNDKVQAQATGELVELTNVDLEQQCCKRQSVDENVGIADMIGELGFYQIMLASLTTIRYILVAMMTNAGPMLAPEIDFWCSPSGQRTETVLNNTSLKNACEIAEAANRTYACTKWTYDTTKLGHSATDEFDLVCDRDWLRSALQSSISIGVVIASVVCGSFSDVNGRHFTMWACYVLSLVCGLASFLAPTYVTFIIARSLCTFGDIGIVASLYTMMVETLGNKHRGTVCLIVYTGWAAGVMVLPMSAEYFRDFRQLMLFTVTLHLCTLPWLMTTRESVRWLMVNGKLEEARNELQRIRSWNCCTQSSQATTSSLKDMDRKFEIFKMRYVKGIDLSKLGQKKSIRMRICLSISGGLHKIPELFHGTAAALSTIAIIWVTFNSELLYMLFILINSDIGTNVQLNYFIGGCMETLATIVSIIIVNKITRRFSLSLVLIITASLCFILAFVNKQPVASVYVLNLAKLSISTLSSIVYVTTTELFPTNLRQTGFGLTSTLGSMGAVIAPFLRTELVNMIGMSNVMFILVICALSAAIFVPMFLRETKGQLADDVE